MTKEAEQLYLSKIGKAGWNHSLHKPFSDEFCGLNLASMGFIISLLPPPPARLLDLGCGGGWTSIFFAKHGYNVLGQDISEDMLALAHENKRLNNLSDTLRFTQADYESLDSQGEFDCAVFFDSLHHADDEGAAIRSVYRSLKPGGILLTHEPGEGHSVAPGSVEAMNLYGVNERDMPPHLIIRRGREAGFRDFRIYPMPHDLITTFYEKRPPSRLSWAGLKFARRVLRLAFRPSARSGAIVKMVK
jgi:SAM-dependent methyltransferase